ncbi:DUF883 family protein [Pelagibacterium limicola]|uniref:DUF883 family protein n=1 Tax=Pelagibacterium limicola TaxID=2791022 RepID=UPI0018AFDD7C|nr:hypothetical protein [Pelagibacterium limicola]
MARAASSSSTPRSSNGNVKDPAKDLDAEIAALREDISAITATLGDIARYRTSEAKSEMQRAGRKVIAKGEEAVETAQQNFEYAEDEIKTMIREKPIASVLVAAGVGYVLSKILRV